MTSKPSRLQFPELVEQSKRTAVNLLTVDVLVAWNRALTAPEIRDLVDNVLAQLEPAEGEET